MNSVTWLIVMCQGSFLVSQQCDMLPEKWVNRVCKLTIVCTQSFFAFQSSKKKSFSFCFALFLTIGRTLQLIQISHNITLECHQETISN